MKKTHWYVLRLVAGEAYYSNSALKTGLASGKRTQEERMARSYTKQEVPLKKIRRYLEPGLG